MRYSLPLSQPSTPYSVHCFTNQTLYLKFVARAPTYKDFAPLAAESKMPELSEDWLEVCDHPVYWEPEDVDIDHDGIHSTKPLTEVVSASVEVPRRSLHRSRSWRKQSDLHSPILIQVFTSVRLHPMYRKTHWVANSNIYHGIM